MSSAVPAVVTSAYPRSGYTWNPIVVPPSPIGGEPPCQSVLLREIKLSLSVGDLDLLSEALLVGDLAPKEFGTNWALSVANICVNFPVWELFSNSKSVDIQSQ